MNLLQVAKQSTEAYMARYFGQHVMDVQVDSDFMTADAIVAWTLNDDNTFEIDTVLIDGVNMTRSVNLDYFEELIIDEIGNSDRSAADYADWWGHEL
jgi:hypothetical protein